MPFEKYLQEGESSQSAYPYYDDQHHRMHHGIDVSTFSNNVQFQIPQFMYSGTPTLAPGGGAEVLPPTMFNDGPMASSWFTNNGFVPKFSEDWCVQSATSKSYSPPHDSSIPHPQPPQQRQLPPLPPSPSTAPPHASASAPFEFEQYPLTTTSPMQSQPTHDLSMYVNSAGVMNSQLPMSPHDLVAVGAAVGLSAPSPLGLPVYSASGFDLLSILARVATRPHPRVVLGPVDLTCSFVVVDVRRHDHPIVYCSPSFCRLTGYEEHEVLGKNCRFLQSPDGLVQRGEPRRFTSPEAVAHLKKSLSADKECQTSIINYRKGGGAFINLVTVIPITGGVSGSSQEDNEIVYHVGFQVDLTEQPNAILQKLRDGSYLVNYSSQPGHPASQNLHTIPLRDRKANAIQPSLISKDLKRLLADPKFIQSIPITTTTTVSAAVSANEKTSEAQENNQILNLILLEASPDFIHVVSLKGSFLYVAPSVRRVLGYEPEELVGKSIADFTHPEDVVPLMRELKESSATGPSAAGTLTSQDNQTQNPQYPITPRTVDLLFRARIKTGAYVWVECRGRLHVEPGKGRKAIVLSGRAREMPRLPWASIARGGGVTQPIRVARACSNEDGAVGAETVNVQREFWGAVNAKGILLVVGSGVADVLGWTAAELTGRMMSTLLLESDNSYHILEEELMRMSCQGGSDVPQGLYCRMKRRDGSAADIHLLLYRPTQDPLVANALESVSPAPLIYQIKTIDGLPSPPLPPPLLSHNPSANLFEELEVSRGSSWQYELQQLKFANQRLLDELHTLEAQYQSQKRCSPPYSVLPPVSHIHPSGPVVHAPSPQQPSPRPDTTEWSIPSGPYMHRQFPPQSSLKRSWDAIDGVTS